MQKFAEIEKLNANILHRCFFFFSEAPLFLCIAGYIFNTQTNVIHCRCIAIWLCKMCVGFIFVKGYVTERLMAGVVQYVQREHGPAVKVHQ